MTLENFDQLLDKYAHLLINKGLAVQAGDWVQINAEIEMAPLARRLSREAYEAGAAKVVVDWSDDDLTFQHFHYQSAETLENIVPYEVDKAHYLLGKRTKRLALRSQNPAALEGIEAEKIGRQAQAQAKALKDISIATQANEVSWLVAAGAGSRWAAMVFPDLATTEEQVDALWDQIFKTCRVYADDPIQAWDDHEAQLEEKAAYLNNQQFDALHYRAPGTDLILGLPDQHIWESAGSYNRQGERFIANMPTEEVFTAPDSRRAEGYVRSTKPLSYGGVVIDQMTFHFKNGEIVDLSAEVGEETLRRLVESQAGAKRLGEVALVRHASPISQSGLTFFNTLFDENASNHLAIGQAYASSIENGTNMSQEELAERGINRSDTHVDFMIGSDQMDVDGITKDGDRLPIFRQGDWAF